MVMVARVVALAAATALWSATVAPGARAADSYTLADVAAHSTAGDCWTVVQGNVYDLTNWVRRHPGGPANILRICGKDGTNDFLAMHRGAQKPAQTLAGYLIGTTATATATPPTPGPSSTSYPLAEVRRHSRASDCWTVIDGVVYDLSAKVRSLPGGAANVRRLCGKDGSRAFAALRGSAGKVLDGARVGVLAGAVASARPDDDRDSDSRSEDRERH